MTLPPNSPPVFLSFGSHYNFEFLSHLFDQIVNANETARAQSAAKLSRYWPSQPEVHLLYKGRQALTLVLQALGVGAGDVVLTSALACQAIESGILASGASPGYVDIAVNSVNPGLAEFQAGLKQYPKTKAVLVQHLLGVPQPLVGLRRWCQEHQLLLIEDLAQSVGGLDENNLLLGSTADAVILSFGRDKVLDTVTGGAAWIDHTTHPQAAQKLRQLVTQLPKPNWQLAALDYLYAYWIALCRVSYRYGIGRLLAKLGQQLGVINSPVKNRAAQTCLLPNPLASLVSWRLDQIDQQLSHRRQIAQIYFQVQGKQLVSVDQINQGVMLRFPIAVTDPQQVISDLKSHQYYISDRWYPRPVDSGRLKLATKYQRGSCPRAEVLCRHLLNLPTHQLVSQTQARELAKLAQPHLWKPQYV